MNINWKNKSKNILLIVVFLHVQKMKNNVKFSFYLDGFEAIKSESRNRYMYKVKMAIKDLGGGRDENCG